jgi:hypothetical protein
MATRTTEAVTRDPTGPVYVRIGKVDEGPIRTDDHESFAVDFYKSNGRVFGIEFLANVPLATVLKVIPEEDAGSVHEILTDVFGKDGIDLEIVKR